MSDSKYTVLLVDDSEHDRFFMRKALERSAKFAVLREAHDGQETIEYLSGHGAFADRKLYPVPDILLLDIKMPRKSGYDVLEWLNASSIHKPTVAIISDSGLREDVSKSLALGAAGHFKKTSLKQEQDEMVHKLENLIKGRSEKS